MQVYTSTVHGQFPIYFGKGSLELLLEEVEKAAPDRVFIVTDRTVESLHAESIRENIPHKLRVESIVFNEGEGNKNLATLEHVAGDLLRAGATDQSLILNVGGGVPLDVGGLTASLIHRGVRFANVATTLAAQAGALNTNLQGIHFVGGRNDLRVFRSPLFVIADPDFIATEPERQVAAGLVEFARQALLLGGEHFDRALRTLGDGSVQPSRLEDTLRTAIEQSLAWGPSDPGELRLRELNAYGAAFARALESLADGRLLPGEALFHGLRISGTLGMLHGSISGGEHLRHGELMRRLPVRTAFPSHVRTDRLVYLLHGNNKTVLGELEVPLLRAIGGPLESLIVTDIEIAAAIERARHP